MRELGKYMLSALMLAWMIASSFHVALWFTADKNHIVRKEHSDKYYLLYIDGEHPQSEPAIFVSERFYRNHSIGDQVLVASLPTPGMGSGSKLVCMNFNCE